MGFIRFIFSVIHLGVVLLLLATTLNQSISPRSFGPLNLLSLAFPFLMVVNLLLCMVWIISWRKRAFIFLAASLLLINPTRRWINYSPENKETSDFKVLSFNIRSSSLNAEGIANYIDNSGADVVLLQEATYINPLKNYPYEYTELGLIKVFSKEPIIKNIEVKTNVDIGRASYSDIKIKGQTIRFFNLYMEPFQLDKSMVRPTDNLDENEQKLKGIVKRLIPVFKEHQKQIDNVTDIVRDSPHPVVFAGDFNAVPNSYEYYKASQNLVDAFVQAGSGSGTSFHDYKVPLKIDHIFTSNSIKALTYKVDRDVYISDHFPVMATFKFK